MTAADHSEALTALDTTLRNIEAVLDLDRMRKEKVDLEAAASVPDLWDDPAKAQQVTSRLSYVQGEINRVEKMRSRLDDARVLLELADAEGEAASYFDEVAGEITALQKQIDELEVRTLLSGEYPRICPLSFNRPTFSPIHATASFDRDSRKPSSATILCSVRRSSSISVVNRRRTSPSAVPALLSAARRAKATPAVDAARWSAR